MTTNLLGEGTYGAVREEGGKAVKTFHKLNHMIQEFIAGKYLKNVPNIINLEKCNVSTMEITMTKYDKSLKNFLDNERDWEIITDEVKMEIFKQILIGLVNIHERGLAHGDLKPGNILVNIQGKKVNVYLADLGFVSVSKYAKCRYTAPIFRDIIIRNGPWHDIYSLGMILIEVFCCKKFHKSPTSYSQLHELAREIDNKHIRKAIIKMTSPSHEKRPSAAMLLKEIFGVDMSIIKNTISYNTNIPDVAIKKLIAFFPVICKRLNIKRSSVGARSLIDYLARKNTSPKRYELYCACMVMILSSLFGSRGVSEEYVRKILLRKTYDANEIRLCVSEMINDDILVKHLLD